jgi:hypothetical protein
MMHLVTQNTDSRCHDCEYEHNSAGTLTTLLEEIKFQFTILKFQFELTSIKNLTLFGLVFAIAMK